MEVSSPDESSDFVLSEYDDKEDPNFFRKDEVFFRLPIQVQNAISNSKVKAKHSDFYYRLTDLGAKIDIYNKFFRYKMPQHQLAFMLKQKMHEEQQEKKKK